MDFTAGVSFGRKFQVMSVWYCRRGEILFMIQLTLVLLKRSPVWRIASDVVGYGWITAARELRPVPDCMARVISLIMLPAFCPIIVAPKILSLFASTRIRTIPSVDPSQIALSLYYQKNVFQRCDNEYPETRNLDHLQMMRQNMRWGKCRSKRIIRVSIINLHKPTDAISGSVNVAYGIRSLDILSPPKNSALRMTRRAIKSAACVNLNDEQQSPAAKTCLLLVCNLSLLWEPT